MPVAIKEATWTPPVAFVEPITRFRYYYRRTFAARHRGYRRRMKNAEIVPRGRWPNALPGFLKILFSSTARNDRVNISHSLSLNFHIQSFGLSVTAVYDFKYLSFVDITQISLLCKRCHR